jgi:hypothetical protein
MRPIFGRRSELEISKDLAGRPLPGLADTNTPVIISSTKHHHLHLRRIPPEQVSWMCEVARPSRWIDLKSLKYLSARQESSVPYTPIKTKEEKALTNIIARALRESKSMSAT